MSGFSFGTGSTSGGGFNFGTAASKPATTAATPSQGFSFANPTTSNPSTLNFNLPTPSTTATNASGGGFSLEKPAAAPTTTSNTFGVSSSTTFGITPAPANPLGATPATSTPFGIPPTTTAKFATPATSIPFGSTPAATTSAITFGSSSASTTPFGALGKPSATTATTQSSAAPLASLTTATTTSSTSGLGTSNTPQTLSVRQLEDKLNKWLVELKEQEERFLKQAEHVNTWDQILQTGHDQVQSLKSTLYTVKADQTRLEAELDFIRSQQDELERLLEPLENAVISTPANQLHQGDRQRDNMYHLAQNLDGQLRMMTTDLAKVIEHLNNSGNALPANDPVGMVARILSSHMDTLKWLDTNSKTLSEKVETMAKSSGELRKF